MKIRLVALAFLLALGTGEASQTRDFVLDTPSALAGATGRGVAIFPDGTLRPLPPLEATASFDEPLGLALAVARDGTAYVGTGHPAHLWRVRAGKKELLGELKADQVTSLLLDPDGNLWAATAAPALLVRVAKGTGAPEEVARLSEGNLWDLAWFKGGLVAAAGNPGRLLRLTPGGLEVAAPIPDRHARCLAVAGDELLIGTSGKGLVMRWSGEGAPGVVYDSGFTEIAALAPAPDGVVYAAGLSGDPTLGKIPPKEPQEPTATVTVTESTATTAETPKGPATSEIVRILPAGAAMTVYRFTKQLAGTLAWGDGGLVIGTGLDGELWQLVDGAAAQLDSVGAAQVVRVAGGGEWVLTQGPVRLLHRVGPPHGTFTSPPLDAGQPSQWGEATLQGELPPSGGCTLEFRSGAVATPDDTWSAWSAPVPCSAAKVSAPPARYLQWRVELGAPASGVPARVGRTVVAYRQINLPPEIKDFTVHAPAEVFLKGAPPSDRIVEAEHPDLSGIFTTIDDGTQEQQARLGKKYFRVGYQSLSWRAEDPNGDPLRFTLEVQKAGSGRWWKVRDDLETTVIGVDTQALADGMYRFRLTATDAPANPEAPATAQALSSWVIVNNTPPKVTVTRQGADWVVTVDDALSPIVRVEWNRDADRWHPLAPEDGLLDRPHETFRIPVASGEHVLAVRAMDDHYNRATVAVEEKP
jgi:Two component regulator propeller